MTKKHFQIIAGVIRSVFENETTSPDQDRAVALVAERLAEEFKTLNARFDAERFLAACGVN